MANHPSLDQRNKQVGMGLLQKFNFANPKDTLPMTIVPQVQQELQNYRTDLIKQWKAGKIQGDGIKSENDIMANISPVDGWPGTKTLSFKFPTATATVTTPGGTTTKQYGTDMVAFDRDHGLSKPSKN